MAIQELQIKLTPKASSNRVVVTDSGLNVYVTAIPENNKANKAMIELLADYFRAPKSAFTLVKGHKGRNKVVQYED